MDFHERLKIIRKQSGYLQRDMADCLDMATNAYQRYELGTREPDLEKLGKLADLFKVPVDYLLGRGLFENWDEIMEQKEAIFKYLCQTNPEFKKANFEQLSESGIAQIFYALFSKIIFDGPNIDLVPTIPYADIAAIKLERPNADPIQHPSE